MTGDRSTRATRICALNDAMRRKGPVSLPGARWVITSGIQALGSTAVANVLTKVREFEAFDRDNDPHGEHDFGAVEYEARQVFWKIDYYNRSLKGGSHDPSDESITCRVLTIMFSEEY